MAVPRDGLKDRAVISKLHEMLDDLKYYLELQDEETRDEMTRAILVEIEGELKPLREEFRL